MDKWVAGGIFLTGMATTYLLQKTKVLGAENRVFNAPCTGNYMESKSLTADGYETNAWSGHTGPFSEITHKGSNCTMNCYKVVTWNGVTRHKNTLHQAKATAHQVGNMTPWKDMTKSPQTSCPNCCTSGSSTSSSSTAGSTSGGGSSTSSSTTSCPACDSCCGQCPECMDCPPPVKCDSCCEPCRNTGSQSTFFGRFFGR